MDEHLAGRLASAMTHPGDTAHLTADPGRTTASFTVKERLGLVTVEGTVPVVSADVTLDHDGLPRGTARLDVTRLDTHNARRDKDLAGGRFFDSATFPCLDFRSVSTRRSGDEVVVDGLLTVRGEDCPLTLVARLVPGTDGEMTVHATGTFDRMTSPLRKAPRWIIGPAVDIVVDAVLRPAQRSESSRSAGPQ